MICCDGPNYNCDPGGSGGPAGIWDAKLVWEHSPGFFSCERFNGNTYLGTYDTCLGFKAQLCKLETKRVIHTFSSAESVYHLRNSNDGHMYIACEQDSLFKMDSAGAISLVEPQHYTMGYYDAFDYEGHRYSLEKQNVRPPNVVSIRRDGAQWFRSTNFKGKDFLPYNGSIYVSATGVDNAIKAALVRIDIRNRTVHYYRKFGGWTGGLALYNDKVWVTIANFVYNSAGEIHKLDGKNSWFAGVVNGRLLVTSTEGGWRSCNGPSYVYEFGNGKFVKVLTVPDAEPWSICSGGSPDKFYFVTRNQCLPCGRGRVYELTRN